MLLVRTVEPTVEPVTLADAKLHLRVDVTDDDTLITSLIVAARQWCEEMTGRSFVTQTWAAKLPGFPGMTGIAGVPIYGVDPAWLPVRAISGVAAFRFAIRLPRGPVASVTSLTYLDGTGTQQTLDPATYIVAADEWGATVTPTWGTSWPQALVHPESVVVTYRAGYGSTADTVPSPIVAAIKLLIGTWYEQREAVSLSRFTPSEVPFTVDALLSPYRVLEAV